MLRDHGWHACAVSTDAASMAEIVSCKLLTLAVFMTAPRPVAIPQPSRETGSRGASLLILAQLTSWMTVYSENVEVPICNAARPCCAGAQQCKVW